MSFTMPPDREMPSDVRDRLREKLWDEVHAPFRPSRSRAPIAVAAGVAVLAAGAVVAAQLGGSPAPAAAPQEIPTPMTSATESDAGAQLDRCWSAVRTSGLADAFPDRTQWTVSFSFESSGAEVVAARADGKPLFCETTLTSVTVSDPNATPQYAQDTTTAALLATPSGIVAGVADPRWTALQVRANEREGPVSFTPAEQHDGLFVTYTGHTPEQKVPMRVRQLPEQAGPTNGPDDDDQNYPLRPLPAPPKAALSIVDHPAAPPDRATQRGKELAGCLAAADGPVPDRDSWQPGAQATIDGSQLIMAYNDRGVGTCLWHPGHPDAQSATITQFDPYIPFAKDPQPIQTATIWVGIRNRDTEGGMAIMGTVQPEAARMQVAFDGKPLETDLAHGTFVTKILDTYTENGSLNEGALDRFTVTINDPKGNQLYNGPLQRN
jgi:hypothetical protein